MRHISTLFIVLVLAIPAMAQSELAEVTQSVEVFEKGYIQVVAESEAGQSRFRALRAAEVLAQRRMLEIFQGLQLYGATTISDGMLASDTINTTVKGFLKGAIACGKEFDASQGYGRVCLRLGIRGNGSMYETFLPLIRDNSIGVPKQPAYQPVSTAMQQAVRTQPKEVVYDGLILDVRGLGFKPAMVNRVLTDSKQLLFGPSKVLNQLLIERGCGGYTTDLAKAKALLSTWGSKAPLTIKGASVDKGTDVVISGDDAARIFANDEKSNMVAQARVVFVLK